MENYSDIQSSTNGSSPSNRINKMKDKFSEQAVALKDRINEQAGTLGNQLGQKIDNARGSASTRLKDTSRKIQNLAIYVEEHDAKDMSDTVMRNARDFVRKYPGRSLLVGIVAGLVVGRILRAR
jgi:ElaB/YqjD/DUF883 family membrane-anchored ribosome-binding protein